MSKREENKKNIKEHEENEILFYKKNRAILLLETSISIVQEVFGVVETQNILKSYADFLDDYKKTS